MAAGQDPGMDHETRGEKHAGAIPVAPGGATPADPEVELWEVNEQLLMAGLREHELVDQLGHQLAFTSAITGSLAEGVFAIDQQGRITFANPAAEQLLGWTQSAMLGREAHEVIQLAHAGAGRIAPADSPLLDVLRTAVSYRDEDAVFTGANGKAFPVSYSAAAIVIDTNIMGAVVAFHDRTELQRLQERQAEYLALMSHDLRKPLTVILGYANLAQRRLAAQGFPEVKSIAAIVESGKQMNRMIQAAIDRGLLEASDAALHLAPVDLVQLLHGSIERNFLPAESARIQASMVTRLLVSADPDRIERVIVNLIGNALKYSPSDSPVVVRLYADGNDAVVAVEDHGRGVDVEDLAHLFEKHYRARTSGSTEGAGLGLYSSRLIVEAHGGQIWARSEVGIGSAFAFSLPVNRH